jgi:hypothetical protein
MKLEREVTDDGWVPSSETLKRGIAKSDHPAPCLHTGDHAAFEYETEGELLTVTVPYLLEGLHARDKVVYVADQLDPNAIRAALSRTGVDVFEQERAGRLAFTTARDAFFPTRRFNADSALARLRMLGERAPRDGFGRIRLGVEMTYLSAEVPGIERALHMESRANHELFGRMPFIGLCMFNRARQSSEMLANLRKAHPVLLVGSVRAENPFYQDWSELERSLPSERPTLVKAPGQNPRRISAGNFG